MHFTWSVFYLLYIFYQKLPSFQNLLPVKIQGDSCSFDIAESKCDNQIALSSIIFGERGLNWKTEFVIKK